MPLTDVSCRSLKPSPAPRKVSDGGGLYLLIAVNGSKFWRMNYRFQGKQKTLALGVYPKIGLSEARAMRDRAKQFLLEDVDPAGRGIIVTSNAPDSFEVVATEWLEAKRSV